MQSLFSLGGSSAAAAPANPNNDLEVTARTPVPDSISTLSWSPTSNHLTAGSWDNQMRLWEITQTGQANPMSSTTAEGPVLCSTWGADGQTVFFAGCDSKVRCWNLGSGQTTPIGQHNAPIKTINWVSNLNCVLTGGWDNSLRYWDGRSPNAVCTVPLNEKVYCADVKNNLCVVGTSERDIYIFDLTKPQTPYKKISSPLKWQFRCVACFPDTTGFAVGSIEGRVAINHVEEKDLSKNFAFKCHRENNDTYAVNSISFHPGYSTFATTGSDGKFNFWDKDSKQRLKQYPPQEAKFQLPPIPVGTFNRDGSLYAYAYSYDWSKGHEFYDPNQPNRIFVHATTDVDVKPRQFKANTTGGRKK